MKLSFIEKILIHTPVRVWTQKNLEIPFFLNQVPLPPSAKILEIGCGRGMGLQLLMAEARRRGTPVSQAWGGDLDEKMVGKAQARLRHTAKILQADAEQLPWANESFDAVFDFGALHHVPNWQKGVEEIYRVLRPGGAFYGLEFYKKLICNPVVRIVAPHPQENRFTHKIFCHQLKSQNFVVQADKHTIDLWGMVVACKKQ